MQVFMESQVWALHCKISMVASINKSENISQSLHTGNPLSPGIPGVPDDPSVPYKDYRYKSLNQDKISNTQQ